MEYYITIEGRTVGPMTKEQIFAYKREFGIRIFNLL